MGLQDVWGQLVAWDLFLAGAGAGAYLVGVIAGLFGERYRHIQRMGAYLGTPLVGIGALILLLDLGDPALFMMGFLRPFSSIMSVGIIFISVFLLLGAINFIVQLTSKEQKLGWLWIINGLFAIGVMGYTGLLLGVLSAIPFWNTPALPVLFISSALATGTGAIFLGLAVTRWVRPAKAVAEGDDAVKPILFLTRFAVVVAVVEVFVLAVMLLVMAYSGTTQISIEYLLAGDYALAFWLGIIVVGLLVPIAILAITWAKNKSFSFPRLSDLGAVAGVCLLLGGIVLRYAILAAGVPIGIT